MRDSGLFWPNLLEKREIFSSNVCDRRCAGLDAHAKSVTVCIRHRLNGSSDVECEEAVFGTFTQDLVRLRKWLRQHGVRQVVVESMGVCWIPVWHVLEGPGLNLMLVEPGHHPALQGRKTDRMDARRLAEYLQHGLLNGTFAPGRQLRRLRELMRMRVHVQQDRNRTINRIGRLLERVLAAGVRRPEILADPGSERLGSRAHQWLLSAISVFPDRTKARRRHALLSPIGWPQLSGTSSAMAECTKKPPAISSTACILNLRLHKWFR